MDQVIPVAEEIIDHVMSTISKSVTEKLAKIHESIRDNLYDRLENISKD